MRADEGCCVGVVPFGRPWKGISLPGEHVLEPEAFGMCEMLDHAQGCPSAGHGALPDRAVVEALDDGKDAAALGLQECQEVSSLCSRVGRLRDL
jgi:hypothetical protein